MSAYSHELYDAIAEFGLRRGATILDVGCGSGAAAEPFVQNGFPVTGVDSSDAKLVAASKRLPTATFVKGQAEALPFPNERFDVVICAQTIASVDRARMLSEAFRVLRKGGIIAVWWKNLMAQDTLRQVREDVCFSLGAQPVDGGLSGGFKEFYAAPFAEQTLRVLPWRVAMPLDEFIEYERSRDEVGAALGGKAEQYFQTLEQRVRERAGGGNATVSVAFIQYLYMAKKP